MRKAVKDDSRVLGLNNRKDKDKTQSSGTEMGMTTREQVGSSGGDTECECRGRSH